MQKLLTQEVRWPTQRRSRRTKQPVGVPALPIFDKATYDASQAWIKDYINVPTAQMTPFTSKIFEQQIVTEPTAHTQELYAALDPVVQAVLTDKNADIDKLLNAANTKGPGHPQRPRPGQLTGHLTHGAGTVGPPPPRCRHRAPHRCRHRPVPCQPGRRRPGHELDRPATR
jgi:hypothetical protein